MRDTICALLMLGLAAPSEVDAQTTRDDYPPAALREHREGTTALTVTVDVTGRGKNCIVTISSGSSDLDAASCRLVITRGRWSPAKDENGTPIESTYSSKVVWKLRR